MGFPKAVDLFTACFGIPCRVGDSAQGNLLQESVRKPFFAKLY